MLSFLVILALDARIHGRVSPKGWDRGRPTPGCAPQSALERELLAWHRASTLSRRLAGIPGIGPLTATALAMKVPDPAAFSSARHFAAWLGLTPKDHSTAGRQRLGGITRAGDEGLRRLLVVGATTVVQSAKPGRSSPWLLAVMARKPRKLAAVAWANKMARTAWAMMVSGEAYRSQPAATPAAAAA